MQEIKQMILDNPKYNYITQDGSTMFKNIGMGLMTKNQRDSLMKSGKMRYEDDELVICTRPVGVVEYSDRGSEVIKREILEGLSAEHCKAQVEALEEELRKEKKCRIHRAEVDQWPLWDGNLN